MTINWNDWEWMLPMEKAEKAEWTIEEANSEGYIFKCSKHGKYAIKKGGSVRCPGCK